jgi:Holliday junction resolvase RusA-like endonuclease
MPSTENPFLIESSGASKGVNPFFGEWRQKFKFPPVASTAKADRRKDFRTAIQSAIDSKYYFTDEVKVEITLQIDEQRIRETDKTADLDNFAKCILDCIKGKSGILIDDCQIQRLGISWIDISNDVECFEIEIRGHPDEFLIREVTLYEMPDKLWYPLSSHSWSDGEAVPINEVTRLAGPLILEAMTDFSRKLRATMRASGLNKMQAYRESMCHSTGARGFHKSRVEGEWPLVPLKDWKADMDEFSRSGDDKTKAVSAILIEFKEQKEKTLSILKELYRSN